MSTNEMRIVIGPFGRSAGERVPIESAATDCAADRDRVAHLQADGFASFVRHDGGIVAMAVEAIEDCLRQTSVRRMEIDAAIISTESLWDMSESGETAGEPEEHLRFRDGLLAILLRAGIACAQPFSNGLSGCANSLAALTLGQSLVRSGRYRCVLALMTDRLKPGSSRFVRNDIGIYSDIAVACLIMAAPVDAGGYVLRHLVSHTHLPLLAQNGEDEMNARVNASMLALRTFETKIAQRTGTPLRDYRVILADNLAAEYFHFICYCLSIGVNRLSFFSKAEDGHAFSADWLLSLRLLREAGVAAPEEPIAVLNLGFFVFSFAELCYLPPGDGVPAHAT
jgi:hypothetical protein